MKRHYVRVCVRSCTRSKIYVHIIKCAMILIFYRFFHLFVNKSEIYVYKSINTIQKYTQQKLYFLLKTIFYKYYITVAFSSSFSFSSSFDFLSIFLESLLLHHFLSLIYYLHVVSLLNLIHVRKITFY